MTAGTPAAMAASNAIRSRSRSGVEVEPDARGAELRRLVRGAEAGEVLGGAEQALVPEGVDPRRRRRRPPRPARPSTRARPGPEPDSNPTSTTGSRTPLTPRARSVVAVSVASARASSVERRSAGTLGGGRPGRSLNSGAVLGGEHPGRHVAALLRDRPPPRR